MESKRIYKIRVGEGILRQMVFTNLNICIFVAVAVNLLFLYLVKDSITEIKVMGVSVISTLIVVLLTYKFERQSLINLIPKAYKYYLSKKYDQY
ncbi:MAG: hypothetical protein WCO33_05180 [bacterium]